MLHLVFHCGGNRYALPATAIEEVLPLLAVTPLPGAPPGIAGAMNFRGEAVPVVDLAQVLLGCPAREMISTRLLLVNYTSDRGHKRRLGCIAERATETLRCEPDEFKPAGVAQSGLEGGALLGPVRPDSQGMVQLVSVDALLPDAIREALLP